MSEPPPPPKTKAPEKPPVNMAVPKQVISVPKTAPKSAPPQNVPLKNAPKPPPGLPEPQKSESSAQSAPSSSQKPAPIPNASSSTTKSSTGKDEALRAHYAGLLYINRHDRNSLLKMYNTLRLGCMSDKSRNWLIADLDHTFLALSGAQTAKRENNSPVAGPSHKKVKTFNQGFTFPSLIEICIENDALTLELHATPVERSFAVYKDAQYDRLLIGQRRKNQHKRLDRLNLLFVCRYSDQYECQIVDIVNKKLMDTKLGEATFSGQERFFTLNGAPQGQKSRNFPFCFQKVGSLEEIDILCLFRLETQQVKYGPTRILQGE